MTVVTWPSPTGDPTRQPNDASATPTGGGESPPSNAQSPWAPGYDPTRQAAGSYGWWNTPQGSPGPAPQQGAPGYPPQQGVPGYHWPGYGQPVSPPRRRSGTVVWVAVAAAVLLAVSVGVVYLAGSADPISVADRTAAPSTSRQLDGRRQRPVKPLNPGWTAIWSNSIRLAYDIPPGWHSDESDRVPGFASADGRVNVPLMAVGLFGADYCRLPGKPPGGWRAVTALTAVNDDDSVQAAKTVSENLVASAFTLPTGPPPKVETGEPSPYTANGVKGTRVSTRLTLTPQGECDPPAGRIDVITVDMGPMQAVFMLLADQGVPDKASDEQIERIIQTVRSSAPADA